MIGSNCQQLVPVERCKSTRNQAYFVDHLYSADPAECVDSGYASETKPYFYAFANGDKQIFRWKRATSTGDILHYFLQDGENPGTLYKLEGPAWKITATDFIHAKKTALYRCLIPCSSAFPNQQNCDGNMQWVSVREDCEGTGLNKGLLGYGILP
jgi:hypothetical protein